MRVSTVKEFKAHATEYLRSDEPLLITRRGKIAGFFIPVTDSSQLPLDVRNQLLTALVERVREKVRKKGLTEEEISAQFEAFRKARRCRHSGSSPQARLPDLEQ
jgi:PHD/YefM family antitoxin component YafN of YafNO toxin-antitoxin module